MSRSTPVPPGSDVRLAPWPGDPAGELGVKSGGVFYLSPVLMVRFHMGDDIRVLDLDYAMGRAPAGRPPLKPVCR